MTAPSESAFTVAKLITSGIHNAGADPGFREGGTIFTSGGGCGGGVPSLVTARGSGGTLIVPPVGPGAKPQPLFLLLRLFSMKIHILLTCSDINLILITTKINRSLRG